jgi:hypothetical protein
MSWQSCLLSSSSDTALYGSVVTQRENVKVGPSFPKNGPFITLGQNVTTKLDKIQGKNVTDLGINYYSESKCHTVANRPNFLHRNVTILGGWTILPL